MAPPLWTLLTLRVALAASEASAFSLAWRVPCAPAPEAAELVGAAEGAVDVEAAPDGSRWRLVVRFIAPSAGERVVRTDTCAEAAQAALVLVRLGARGQRGQTEPAGVEAPLAPPSRPRASLALTALAEQGTLPSLAARLAVTGGLEWAERWALLLSLRAGGPTVVPGGPAPGARVSVQPVGGGQLSGCWQPHAGRASGGPCALVAAEAWRVSGENVARPRTGTGVSVVAGLEARGALRLWRSLSATAVVGGRVALVRPSVSFEDSGVLFQAGALSAAAELGLQWVW